MRRYIILLALSVACAATATATGPDEKPKNDVDDSSLNSLEDVSISCEGSECDGDGDKWTTTKKPHIFQLSSKSCPVFELPSVFPRQLCDTDRQCWPRICCGYGGINGHKYCRIPLPSWRNDLLKSITKKLRSSQPYLQCSPPPPKRYDLFPRKCRTTVDCWPDLCCPENGNNICRPPKQSLQSATSRRQQFFRFGK
ncbi:uncharacterized protein LOC126837673 [Adelges cooleyi]|uniref:uncharacterized protein LOC126837673 n=1 Tax=Adelges cooleyi TaxID=133065 RepID=UPI0021802FD5|nr:uncharacterized protein LOC126837673 [Adelges cooleyi]